jgi:DNA processing protein
MAPDELAALAINRIPFLKPREKLLLLEVCAAPERLASLPAAALPAILGRAVRSRNWDPQGELRRAEADQKLLTSGSIRCTFIWSPDFPLILKEIYDPPVVLYYRGILPKPQEVWIGIVGTRQPTGIGRDAAFALGFELAGLGVGTVSGLARGIDSEAHRGCLAEGGRTVGVLGNGIDRVFPDSSAPLGRRILASGGCILSEYPPGEPPRPYHFPGRNRIISGLSRAVVVVQAPEGSGALITADYALEQGRELLVHADGLEGSAGAGTRALAEEGAQAVRGAAEVLAGWGEDPLLRRKNPLLRHGRLPALAARQAAAAAADPQSALAALRAALASHRWSAAEELARQLEGELAHELAVHNGEVLYG